MCVEDDIRSTGTAYVLAVAIDAIEGFRASRASVNGSTGVMYARKFGQNAQN